MLIETRIPTTTITPWTRFLPFLLNKFIVYLLYTMKDFRTRKKQKGNFLHSWVAILFLGFLLGIFIKSTYASFVKKSQAEQERVRYNERLEELQNKRDDLEAKIESLNTERGREEEFRKRFNVVKEGETMIRIVEE